MEEGARASHPSPSGSLSVDFTTRDIATIALVILAVLAMKYVPRWMAGVPFLDAQDVKRRLDEKGDDAIVLDVRTAREFTGRTGHIPGAVNLPVGDLTTRLQAVSGDLEGLKTHPVFIHCHNETRAARAARVLRKAGFTDLSVIKGGIRGWLRHGLPVEGKS